VSEPEASDAAAPSADGYDEPARSYALLWFFAALLAAGFVFDLILGGAVAHLLGWAIATVLVLGFNFVLIYAVRSEKSLRVTAAQIRVGDEAIGRAEVVAVAPAVDADDLPVLGWPTGKPRKLTGVTVRLFDGQDVVVPTRHPDRLEAALGLGSAGGPTKSQDVRAAGRADLPLLDDLGQRADSVFRAAGYRLPEIPLTDADLRTAKAVFVAGRPPIGYVRIDEVDGLAHLAEIAVIPKWMRQGIGNRLLERACEWARRHDYPAITLTTYADVPWNGPYYAARGFLEVTDPTPGLLARRDHERELGLDAVGRRIVMRRELEQ
jgi:GNAT superfamily N-acetyltransferase